MSPALAWRLARDTVLAWVEDSASSMGAAIAFYTLFSLAPLLVIVIAVAGFFFGEAAARGELFDQIGGLVGPESAAAVQGMVESANQPGQGLVAAAISLVLTLVGATAVFGELQSALDRIWRSPATPEGSGFWSMIRGRLLSFGMVMGIAFLLLVSLVVSAGISAVGKIWERYLGSWETVLQAVNVAVSLVVFTAAFALIYRYVPRTRIAWRDVWIGAAVTSVLFSVGKLLIGLYIGKSGVASSYGAAGSLAALMIWVYYSAQVFLLGAEFTWVYAHGQGSRAGTQPPPLGQKKRDADVPAPPPEPSTPARTHPARAGLGETVAALALVTAAGAVAGWFRDRAGRRRVG